MKLDLHGWFPDKSRDILEKLIKDYNIKSIIEIGCFLGRATVWFATRVDKVTVVDVFGPTDEEYLNTPFMHRKATTMYDKFVYNMKYFNLLEKVAIIKATSKEAVEVAPTADLIYIDASHEYEDIKEDIKLWYPKANKILCGDDYSKKWEGVRKAVDEVPFHVNKNQRLWYHIK